MKQIITITVALGFISIASSQQIITGKNAGDIISKSDMIRYKKGSNDPNYIHFNNTNDQEVSEVFLLNVTSLKSSENNFKKISSDKDPFGYTHCTYQHVYKDIPVQYSLYKTHSRNNILVSVSGNIFGNLSLNTIPSITKETAIENAKKFVSANIYKWELESEEKFIKWRKADNNATYYPSPELVIAPINGQFEAEKFRLCWKMEIYAHEPMSKQTIYIDAVSGEIVWTENEICTTDTPAPAATVYSGVRQIISDSFGGGYRLRESGRGDGVETYNLLNGTNYGAAVDFVDADNVWDTFAPASDQYAIDAHWGAEMTYDYFFIKHGRNSIDNAGFKLVSYIHYDVGYANAFWNGSEMTYGDGGGSITPLTTVDIVGHEITHGLTNFSADLIYQDESGALNESFSDIFGATIDHEARNVNNDTLWRIGEECFPPNGIRHMSNPSSFGDPDTYEGTGWIEPGGPDNGGVHTNSGVQNYWYHLMCEGGAGINDNGDAYNVSGVGMDTAATIAFRNLTVYLFPNADFSDARFYSIISAQDLYGDCSPQVETTTNAWYAVGVGEPYSDGVTAAFTPSAVDVCTSPTTVTFTNQTASGFAATTYLWNFGDATTSTQVSPVHNYTSNGTYTITLIANAGGCGIDTLVYTDMVTINRPAPPDVNNYCTNTNPVVADISAIGSGTTYWFSSMGASNPFFIGNTYTTPSLTSGVTYYVEDRIPNGIQHAPPFTNAFGTGNYFNSPHSEYLEFTVYQPITLVSVRTYSGSSGNRTIELWNGSGTLLDDAVVNIPTGESVVPLNWDLMPGNYRIGGTSMNLWKNGSGTSFPYTLPSLLSITGTSDGTLRYFYFYDWEVASSCISQRIPVIVNLNAPHADFNYNIAGTTVSFTNTSSNGTSYWWDFGGGNTSTLTNPSHDYDWGGTHYATLVAINNGCYDTTYVALNIIGIEENSEIDANIYPVPFHDQLQLHLTLSGLDDEINIGLYDILGAKVSDIYNGSTSAGAFSYIWQTPPTLRSGMYLIKINYNGKELVKRVIKF